MPRPKYKNLSAPQSFFGGGLVKSYYDKLQRVRHFGISIRACNRFLRPVYGSKYRAFGPNAPPAAIAGEAR
jgi:hypothetical protein